MARTSYDYIVIGAGSAGCAIAARLSEDSSVSVLLLESGGPARRLDWRIQMPAAMAIPMRTRSLNWGYHTEPQNELNGRRIHWARGRIMGGSSSINGMAYVRGNALDFDGWSQDPGLRHWRFAEVLPYFKRLETYDRGGDAYRGESGPVRVQAGRGWSPLYEAFVAAGVEAGYPATDDMNGYQQEGFGVMDMTVHGGRRVNAAEAYLEDHESRPNLTIVTRAHVARLLFDGARCTGVAFKRAGIEEKAHADREVVLAAGAVGSPQTLLLSGIGPADEVRAAGIEPFHDLPGVGRNLQDHLEVFVQHACTRPVTLYPSTKLARRGWIGGRWLLTRTGWGATNHMEAGGFIRSREGVAYCDVQYHFLPRAVPYNGNRQAEVRGFQAHVATMRSKSRGWLRLRSDRHTDHPVIEPCYMTHPDDWIEMRAAIRHTREVLAQPALDPYRGREISPGPEANSDAEIDAFIRSNIETGYHPCGACKMGTGPDAVVDGDLKVHGLEGLRVADSSILPTIITGNLNAATIMIGEKAADIIRGRRLPAEDVPIHIPDSSSQR